MIGWKASWHCLISYSTIRVLAPIWSSTNRKPPHRKGKVQLVDGTSFYKRCGRAGRDNKRHEICDEQRAEITRLYGEFQEEFVRIFDNEDFGYQRITVERPLRLNFAVTDERLERVKETRQFPVIGRVKKAKG